jgi:hypothetical protein
MLDPLLHIAFTGSLKRRSSIELLKSIQWLRDCSLTMPDERRIFSNTEGNKAGGSGC